MTGIPPLPIYTQSYPRLTSIPHDGPSNFVLTSPVERELCEFLQELNESSSLGLTGSELVSLAKGNFVPSPSNFRVEGPRRIPSSLADFELLAAYPSGLNCGTIGLNSILPAAGRPHLDEAPPRAGKSGDKERPATAERTLRLHTFSTAAGRKSQCDGKSPKSLSCSHESFPQNSSSTNENAIGRTTSKSKSSGSGHQSKCDSSSEASFQCRVIKLTQREHMILQRYEKLTKSMDKLNKVAAAKKSVQLFLLTRSQEVHVSGKDFEFARINLLKFIRLSQVWWDKRRQKGATAKLTSSKFSNLNLQERLQKKMSVLSKLPSVQRGPKPEEIHSMAGASVDTSSAVEVLSKRTSVGGIFQLFPHLCANFPDCSNKSPSMKISKNCMQVQIQPEFLHSLFVEGDQKFDIMHKISSTLAAQNIENVKVCLLRKSPAFHVLSEDGNFLQQAIKYLWSLMRRFGTLDELELEFGNKSGDPPEPDVPQEPQPPPGPLPKTIYIGYPPVFSPPPVPKLTEEPLLFPKINKPPAPLEIIKPPPPPRVTQPPPMKSPQKRAPPPSVPKPPIANRAIPIVAKQTPLKKPRMSGAERRKLRNNFMPNRNTQTSKPTVYHQQMSRAREPPKTLYSWQNNNNNNNNFPAHPTNQVWMGPPRMPFGHGPNFFPRTQNNNCPWQPPCLPTQNPWPPEQQQQYPPCPPRQNPWPSEQQQYPPFPPSQFPEGSIGYALWNQYIQYNAQFPQNSSCYPQSTYAFWQ